MRHLIVLLLSLAVLPVAAAAQEPAASPWQDAAVAFLASLERGEADSAAAMLAPSSQGISAEQLRTVWVQVRTQFGRLALLTPGAVTAADSLRLVEVSARFERARLGIRVTLTAARQVAGFHIMTVAPVGVDADTPAASPPYVDTTAFREVTVAIGEGRWRLPATLSIPATATPVPAVVLVYGSGPNDRDGTIGPNKPLRDIAWGLASLGIAVLRYDKRTYAHAGALAPGETTLGAEVIDDALAALSFVRARTEIDASRVVLVGHSLGGMLAPEIAARDGRLAGVAILAAPARDIRVVIAGQLDYLVSLAPTDAERDQLHAVGAQVEAIRAGSLPADSVVLGAPVRYWNELSAVEPAARARTLDVPLLILQGGRDYQSTMEDFGLWHAALGGRPGVTLRSYPALDHLFMSGSGTATPSGMMQPGHVAQQVVRDLAEWIDARGR
ncbi:MAG TPA: alpha/beta fold hydrolase [Gemmatimonadaceae bacterium]|nr:alpha/beta fold hydrolase [Gemmatimonadaceae bacterium]